MTAWRLGSDSQIAGGYDLLETIGRGHFAVVKKAKHVFTGEVVATKVVDKTKLDDVARQHLYHEVRCMKLVQHPYVVRLYEVIDTKSKLYLIQEYGDGGDLFEYIIKRDNGLGEDIARKYFRQIVSAVAFCHHLHVVHRDLKPENCIFFPKLDVVKVTDFGFSNSFIPGDLLNTACGSLAYSAPEVLLGDAYDAVASDIWSLGVILYMLVVGRLPFSEANDSETLTKIMDCQFRVPTSLSNSCQRLVKRLLVKEPLDRLSVENILKDDWFGSDTPDDIVNDAHPLMSRRQLSEEDREHIIDIMVSGNVATREKILSSLEEKSYNHLEATFYLLAERHLASVLVQQHLNRSLMQSRNFAASSSTSSVFSGSRGSGENLLANNLESSLSKKNADTMSAISEAEVSLEEKEEEELQRLENSKRFSILIEEAEDPDELPQIYEIREGVDDLEVECLKSSLTRLANIAEMSESDDAVSSGRPSGRRSIGGPSDSGPEHDAANIGSPSIRPRSARSSWISASRRSSAAHLRSGSLSGRPPSLSRISAPPSVSPYSRLTRSASSSDTSDIESESVNRNLARMKRCGFTSGRHSGCFRCDLDFHRSLAASLLKGDPKPRVHRRHHRHRRHPCKFFAESSEPATTSASDTEQPFSAATSRCQSAAASVTFILGAVANEAYEPHLPLENVVRRSSLPHAESASLRAWRQHNAEEKAHFTPLGLQKVPFDQQKLPNSYRQALQMRLNHRHGHGKHHRFATLSDASLPPGSLAHRNSFPEHAPSGDKIRSRNAVPRIDELSSNAPPDSSSREHSPILNGHIPSRKNKNGSELLKSQLPPVPSCSPYDNNQLNQLNCPNCDAKDTSHFPPGHASAPPTTILSGASGTGNRRTRHHHHHHHQCEVRPLNQLALANSQRMSEFSVSTTSRGTGSECSLPASSAPSIRNGMKTPSVSSVRSDPDLVHYRNLPCSAIVGGSCRTSRIATRNPVERKRSGDDCEALLGSTSPNEAYDANVIHGHPCRCGSLHHRRRGGSSSSYRSGGNRTGSVRSNASCAGQETSLVSVNGVRVSVDAPDNRHHHHKRNLLRSLFSQCFGCSLGNGHHGNVKKNRLMTKKKSPEQLRKAIDTGGIS